MTLIEAAQQLVSDSCDVHGAEVLLAQAIESGDLTANVKRWATEQWAGRQLPGNINARETFVEPADLRAWRARCRD
jgi:hypothetical protein